GPGSQVPPIVVGKGPGDRCPLPPPPDAMTRLRLQLLGGFLARLDEDRTAGMSVKKAQALLAYLAISLGQPHPRDKLAALLWGDVRQSQARGGLRHTIFSLRKVLGDTGVLRLDGETVALDPAGVVVDVREFEQCVAAGTRADLERAADLYQGDLLEGLVLE